jgi:LPXTG-motif cell wall-anchored protein
VQQPYSALVATSEPSSSGTVALEQPPAAPAANSTPTGGSGNTWLIAGIVVLVLLIGAGIGVVLRRRRGM